MNITEISDLLSRVTLRCLEKDFTININKDERYWKPISRMGNGEKESRTYIQISYESMCNKTHTVDTWKGRKFYLSEYMTQDEVIKTAYAAFEAAIKHEVMEGFKVDGIILFNPHINFEELLLISNREIRRNDIKKLN